MALFIGTPIRYCDSGTESGNPPSYSPGFVVGGDGDPDWAILHYVGPGWTTTTVPRDDSGTTTHSFSIVPITAQFQGA